MARNGCRPLVVARLRTCYRFSNSATVARLRICTRQAACPSSQAPVDPTRLRAPRPQSPATAAHGHTTPAMSASALCHHRTRRSAIYCCGEKALPRYVFRERALAGRVTVERLRDAGESGVAESFLQPPMRGSAAGAAVRALLFRRPSMHTMRRPCSPVAGRVIRA